MITEYVGDILILFCVASTAIMGLLVAVRAVGNFMVQSKWNQPPDASRGSDSRSFSRKKKRTVGIPSSADDGKVEPLGGQETMLGDYFGMTIASRQSFASDRQVSKSALNGILTNRNGTWTRVGHKRRDASVRSDGGTTDPSC
jgi:hypothetical protein